MLGHQDRVGSLREARHIREQAHDEPIVLQGPRPIPPYSLGVDEPLSVAIVAALFDRMYWTRDQLLDAASRLSTEQFVNARGIALRDLRATLVHELDTERTWRLRLTAQPDPGELQPEMFPDVPALVEAWTQDEIELRGWLTTLSETDLGSVPESALTRDPRPLWLYLLHVVEHASQQFADAARLLTEAGASPGELDFLTYLKSSP